MLRYSSEKSLLGALISKVKMVAMQKRDFSVLAPQVGKMNCSTMAQPGTYVVIFVLPAQAAILPALDTAFRLFLSHPEEKLFLKLNIYISP